MRYAFIEQQRAHHHVRRLCHLLSVSPAGYYEWLNRGPNARLAADRVLCSEIIRIHSESRMTYGRPRIHAELLAQGHHVGAKRVGRIMSAAGVVGVRRRRFRKTTDSDHSLALADNTLARKFGIKINEENRAWAGDITYVQTREGWLYLAVVLDLASRRVIGWSMRTTMSRLLVLDAFVGAVKNRPPKKGACFHSDRGSQYASEEFQDLLRDHGMISSMSRKGDCWDNAVVESFFGSLKTELRDPIWETRAAARAAIFDYIEVWYNRKRRHSTLGYLSPETYESLLPIAV